MTKCVELKRDVYTVDDYIYWINVLEHFKYFRQMLKGNVFFM